MSAAGRPGRLEIELLDARGRRPVRIWLTEHGRIQALDGIRARDLCAPTAGKWMKIRIEANAAKREYALSIDGKPLLKGQFAEPAANLERLSLRTGGYRAIDRGQAGRQDPDDGPPDEIKYFVGTIDPETDRPIKPARFFIDVVRAGM